MQILKTLDIEDRAGSRLEPNGSGVDYQAQASLPHAQDARCWRKTPGLTGKARPVFHRGSRWLPVYLLLRDSRQLSLYFSFLYYSALEPLRRFLNSNTLTDFILFLIQNYQY